MTYPNKLIPPLKPNGVYQGDVRDMLPRVPAESVDLVLTDPPYGVDFQSNMPREGALKPKIENDSFEDAMYLLEFVFDEFKRVLRPGGVACIFAAGGGPRACLPRAWRLLDKALTMENCLVWDRCDVGLGWRYRPIWEAILVAYKGDKRKTWNGASNQSNILRYPRIIPPQGEHPTPKPVNLCTRLVLDNSAEGEVVLDPFCGSGSSLVAAASVQRQWMGIESDATWADKAFSRAQAEQAQLKLF